MSALGPPAAVLCPWERVRTVEVFKYLGRLLAKDDNNIKAIRNQLQKARTMWACVGQVLRGKNASPRMPRNSTNSGSGPQNVLFSNDPKILSECFNPLY
jgi:hypothetical protein